MEKCRFIDENGTFEWKAAQENSGLYFPIANEIGMKSAVTPDLRGDCKLDQNHFVLEPVSAENLHMNRQGRNFWCVFGKNNNWSACGQSAMQLAMRFSPEDEEVTVRAGFMWHEVTRTSKAYGVESKITSFVSPLTNVEVMQVEITNKTEQEMTFTPVAAIPLYGRSADNIRDHRHVTSLLHRIETTDKAVLVNPTLSFDERGHVKNDTIYFVAGTEEDGTLPVGFYPVTEDFIGEGGNLENPKAIRFLEEAKPAGTKRNGQEALGGIRFAETTLKAGESKKYLIYIGAQSNASKELLLPDAKEELAQVKAVWKERVNVSFHTSDPEFDGFMKWVSFQPELRRIYGCSFLPHHDYGRGGRGWRDLWQDCLALLIMDPKDVRGLLLSNFEGVRVDGTNATIIGEKKGEFKADRNSITRVWMDHGVWPFMTTKLYLNQTGDYEMLFEKVGYFKDRQVRRGLGVTDSWNPKLMREEYKGSVLEHLLVQNLAAFWEVGEHNHLRLRDADWNDALDMATKRGESVAFSSAYAKNLTDLAELLEELEARGEKKIEVFEELIELLDKEGYEEVETKNRRLDAYVKRVENGLTGGVVTIATQELANNLREKGEWMKEHIRRTEFHGWYNGYYDEEGKALAGMTLTGQVFAIMGDTATKEQIQEITKNADEQLFDKECGGYRLNVDFGEVEKPMGRMFGFAFGEKENGAVFSHMAVMYANALYTRGFAKEGYKALAALYEQSMTPERGGIYPGIPEYFAANGKGLYHYLTGAASWYMLTVIHQMFGVRGEKGDLLLEPKLLKEQFDEKGEASMKLTFADRKLEVCYFFAGEPTDQYEIEEIKLNEAVVPSVTKEVLASLSKETCHRITVKLKDKEIVHE